MIESEQVWLMGGKEAGSRGSIGLFAQMLV